MALIGYTITVVAKQDNPYNVLSETDISIRKNSDNSLVNIYADEAGLIPIPQIGAKTDSNGQFTFYADASLGILKAVWTNGGVTATEILDKNDHSKLVNRNAVGAHDAGAITNATRAFTTVSAMQAGTSVAYVIGQTLSVIGEKEQVDDYIVTSSAADYLLAGGLYAKKIKKIFKRASELQYGLSTGVGFSIGLYGDSTMYGTNPSNNAVQLTNHAGVILGNVLQAIYPSLVTVSNNAIAGSKLADMIAGTGPYTQTFDAVMAASSASLIYCNHAHNDYFSGTRTLAQFKDDVIEFVRIVRKYNKVPVLVTPNIVNYVSSATAVASQSLKYSAWVDTIRNLAVELNCDLVDIYYYTEKTARSVDREAIVPDGAHPSEKAVRYIGATLALPLLQVASLKYIGDGQGINGTTFRDSITNTRSFLVTNQSYYGVRLTGVSDSTTQRINIPVLLDSPTDDNVVALSCLKNSGGSVARLMHNNTFNDDFDGVFNFNGDLNYNALVVKSCNMWAGLSLVGFICGTAISSEVGPFGISGVKLIPRDKTVSGLAKATIPLVRPSRPIVEGDTIKFMAYVEPAKASVTFLKLSGTLDGLEKVSMRSELGVIKVKVKGVDTTIATITSDGFYEALIRIDGLGSVTYQIGGAAGSTATTSRGWIPDLYIAATNSLSQSFNLTRT